MGKNKPKHKNLTEDLEKKTLVSVTIDFDVETVFNSGMSPDEFGKMVCKHVYKTLPFQEKDSNYSIDNDLAKELF